MKQLLANPEHEVVYQELTALVGRHANKVTAMEILAIAANMVGKLIAMQDQRKYSSAEAIAVVARNIEIGNQQAFEILGSGAGTAH